MLSEFHFLNSDRLKFKTVFVSLDKSEAQFTEYLSSMSWNLAVPFEPASVRTEMRTKFGVSGIPRLVILDATGKVVNDDAVGDVAANESGDGFPWKPLSLWEALESGPGGKVVNAAGEETPVAALKELDAVGLYFSAAWCGPCQEFTPKLADWYAGHCAPGKPLAGKVDIVFVSSDKSDAEADAYFKGKMPWKMLPYAARAGQKSLNRELGVRGIPTLVFVDKEGNVLTKDGRSKVTSEPEGFPWPPKARDTLEDALDYINEKAVLVVFSDACTDPVNELAAVEALDAVAAEHYVGGKPNDRIRFAHGGSDSSFALRVRGFLGPSHQRDKDGDEAIRVTIVDIPAGKKAHLKGTAAAALSVPTKEELAAFVAAFLAGTAPTVSVKE